MNFGSFESVTGRVEALQYGGASLLLIGSVIYTAVSSEKWAVSSEQCAVRSE